MHEINQIFENACSSVSLPNQQNMRPIGIFGGFSGTLGGRSPLADASLRRMRRALRDVSGIYRTDFTAYEVHIILAYQCR